MTTQVKATFQISRALLSGLCFCLVASRVDAAPISSLTYDASGNLTNVASAGAAPTIAVQPMNQVVSENGTVYFNVSANGAGPLSYQWYSNGVPIVGASGDSLAVPGIVVPTNLVGNGNFENPALYQTSSLLLGPGTNFGGWNVGAGNIALVRSVWQPPFGGVQELNLNGNTTGSIYQDIPTVSGEAYYFHFALAGNPTGTPVIKTNQVWWGSNLLDTVTFNTTNLSAASMGWTNREYTVTATNSTMRLSFVSLVAGGYGPVLDNVSLIPVLPPPAAYTVVITNSSGSVTSAPANILFDTDGNGLPDSWEIAYFGATGQDPNADPDGDGVSNLQEYLDGTDPTNPASFRPRLQLLATPGGSMTVFPMQASYSLGQNIQITAVPGSGYTFLYWYGSITNTNSSVNLVMDSQKTITAVFGQIMTNGATYQGFLAAGATNIYALSGNAGDNILLRLGTVGYNPRISFLTSTGVLAGSAANGGGGARDIEFAVRLTNSAEYMVVVDSFSAGGTGPYTLTLAQLPGAFVVSPGDEGGSLTNGAKNTGNISLGDLDLWSFPASVGNNISLRMGTVGFNPNIRLYGPNGALVGSAANGNGGGNDIELSLQATNTGNFTAVLSSYYYNGTGTYSLTLAQSPGGFVVSPGDTGGPMTNGAQYNGNVAVGDLDMWSFNASAGNNLLLRMGTVGFNPAISLYSPTGTLIGSAANGTGGATDVELAVLATNTGTFTVVVDSYYDGGGGSYMLNLAQSPGPFVVSPGDEGGPMTNGWQHNGNITAGDLDMWSFSASTGNNISLRMGTAGFNPMIRLYGPNGVLVSSVANGAGGGNDVGLSVQATNTGVFTVVVNSYNPGGTGSYTLTLAQSPGAFMLSPGDEGGPMTNGVQHAGNITLGDMDMWSFSANSGDGIVLRMGTVGFNPSISLYSPNGTLVGSSANGAGGGRDTELSLRATNSGTFTAVVQSYYDGGTGSYMLNLAQSPEPFVVSPGDEGGPIVNGLQYSGNITLGDLDMWSFPASAGNNLILRMGTAGFNPYLRLYGPDGALVGSAANGAGGGNDVELDVLATNTGNFTVVAASYYDGGTGSYSLNLAQMPGAFFVSPGDEGGMLVNGGNFDSITTLGDLDMWSFTANAKDNIVLRAGEISGTASYDPWIRLYGPDGAYLANNANASDAFVAYQATNSGTFTVVMSSYYLGNTGTNRLRFAKIPGPYIVPPGDDGGLITAGNIYPGTTDLGDEDMWSFTAFKGAPIALSCAKTGGASSYQPWIRLYGPNGASLATANSATTATINYTPTNSGTFTLLVGSYFQGYTGTYQLNGAGFSSGLLSESPAISGTNFTFTEVGGGSNVQFVLYSTTNISTPVGLWTPVLTNRFDASGAFHFTNQFNPGVPRLFYRLIVP